MCESVYLYVSMSFVVLVLLHT